MRQAARLSIAPQSIPLPLGGVREGFSVVALKPSPQPSPNGRGTIRTAVALIAILLIGATVFAKDAQPNEDPQIAQRMKTLTEQLRCLVCQNETLADSRADLAEDLRKQIREQIKAGKSDQEIIAYLTDRYGDFVLYKPPVKKTTYLLWFGPFLFLFVGTGVLFLFLKRRREMIEEHPLTIEERKRAEEMLRNLN
ncbi:MAG TPA: cytochrome c-type biogenesis protein [Pyrinomonadaceae bacterium]|jgi:cytochrome c-type biogenesis protein CcmH|nr:cytochrome c-type biogenesis protein [Pyrinomonadaceae bacterium]